MKELKELLSPFDIVSLAESKKLELPDRKDSKFIFHVDQLQDLLPRLNEFYFLQEVGHKVIHRYRNIYFDTEDFASYIGHHNGKMNRYKFRKRHYDTTDTTFFEIKLKTNKFRTVKFRKKIASFDEVLSRDLHQVILRESNTNPLTLSAKVNVDFSRITLINKSNLDRGTLDFGLNIHHNLNKNSFPMLGIAEIKQANYKSSSPLIQAIRECNIRNLRISKYCLSIMQLYPGIKYNRFKPRQRYIDKITEQALV